MSEQTSSAESTQKTESKVEFSKLSLPEMEKELTSAKEEVQSEESETKDSTTSNEESTETGSTSEDATTTEESVEGKTSEKSDKSFDVNKAYKELQAEFTRRSQRLAELEKKQAESPKKSEQTEEAKKDKLAQLKETNPKAADFIDALDEAIEERLNNKLNEKVSPIEERVTLRTRQENVERFNKSMDEFKKSDLSELEPEILSIYNSEPSFWQQLILDNENAFDELKNRAITSNLEKVVELKTKRRIEAQTSDSKKKAIEKASVGKPSGVSKEVPTKEFKKLSLKEMEDTLPKVDED